MKHRNDLMLLRIAQADAYAAAVEYVKRDQHPQLYEDALKFERYLQHPTHVKLRPGMYTDDTQMSIAVAEALVNDASGLYWPDYLNREQFLHHWFSAFVRDPRDGYSRGFQAILEKATSGVDLWIKIKPDSTKNGAAMRSVPIGVLDDPEEVKRIARVQAETTHNTYEGVAASVAVALMSHFALYDPRDFSNLTEWLVPHLATFQHFQQPWVGRVTGKCQHSPFDVGLNTAWAVHTLLTTKTSLMDIMRQVIEWGGDTDSVAAIAWGIASCRYQDEVLPEFMERDLEVTGNLKYGPKFLRELGQQLMFEYRAA